jgi:hypothetical protein
MARYYASQLVKPISQYAPAPLKYIDEAGAALQNNTDQQLAGVTDLQKTLNLIGGRKTTGIARELANEYAPQVQQLYDDISANGNTKGGLAKIAQLKNQIASRPEYSYIKQDEANVDNADKLSLDPKTRDNTQSINDLYNPDGSWKQVSMQQARGGYDASIYGAINNVNAQKDLAPIYDKIKEQSVKIGGPVSGLIYKEGYDNDGNPTLIGYNQNNQKVRTGIATEDIQKIALNLSKDKNNWNAYQSIAFKDAYQKKNSGIPMDESDFVSHIVDNYPGYHSKEEDLTTEQRALTPRGSGNGSGSGSGSNQKEHSNDNVLYKVFTNADANGGKTKVQNINTMSSILGGEVVELDNKETGVKTKAINVDLTGKNVIITPSKSTNGNTEELDVNLGILKNHNSFNKDKEAIDEKRKKQSSLISDNDILKSDSGNADKGVDHSGNSRQIKDDSNFRSNYVESFREKYGISGSVPLYINKTGHIFLGNEVPVGDGKSSFDSLPKSVQDNYIKKWGERPEVGDDVPIEVDMSIKSDNSFKNELLKAATIKTNKSIDGEYSSLKDKYSSQGYNPDDKSTIKKVEDFKKSGLEKYFTLNTLLIGISGEHIVKPNQDGDNILIDGNKDMYGNARMILTGAELDERGIKVKDFKDIIVPLSKEESFSYGNDDEVQYSVPITMKSEGSIDEKTRAIQTGIYGSDKETEEGMSNKTNETNTYILKNKGNKIVNKVKSDMLNPEGKKEVLDSVSSVIDSFDEDTKSKYNQALKQILSIKDPKEQAREISDLYLFFTNKEAYDILYPADDVGKLNPQKVNSNPLGI